MSEDTTPEPLVLVRREGAITRITLNRPRAINALTQEMAVAVREGVASAEADGSAAVLLDGAGERGFCGGGDVKAMMSGIEAGLDFLREEYRADHAISACRLPVIGIMDGITMGGGIGLTGHASLRVVTERSRLAMPETRIGIVPDVGGNLLFAAAPGRVGEMLAMSSGSLTAGDAIALGFADAFLPSERLEELRSRLVGGEDPSAAVAALAQAAPQSEALASGEWFTPIADEVLGSADDALADPVGAALRLVGALEASAIEPASVLAAEIRALCPASVAVALAQLVRTKKLSPTLAETLREDYRLLGRMMRRPDFAEGVRAQLIDRDGAPRWRPSSLETLDHDEIGAILDPALAEGETALVL